MKIQTFIFTDLQIDLISSMHSGGITDMTFIEIYQ